MTRIGIYTLRIMGPDDAADDVNQEIINNIGGALSQAEDAINDQLPAGYYAKIDES